MSKTIKHERTASKKCKFVEGSDNIFRDLGFANPELEMKICQEKYELFIKQKKSDTVEGAGTYPFGRKK